MAKFYYYPGWWEGGPQISVHINKQKFDSLPKEYQAILQAACADAHVDMMAKYDAKNPTALKQLIGAGTQLRQFPKPVMDACYKAAQEVYAETAAKNPEFKKVSRRLPQVHGRPEPVVPCGRGCLLELHVLAALILNQPTKRRFGARFLVLSGMIGRARRRQRCLRAVRGAMHRLQWGALVAAGMKGWVLPDFRWRYRCRPGSGRLAGQCKSRVVSCPD